MLDGAEARPEEITASGLLCPAHARCLPCSIVFEFPRNFRYARNMSDPLPPDSIFFCYRRVDTGELVDRIYSDLARKFARGTIFRDVDSIPLGVAFPDYIAKRLRVCRVVLVFIGRDWLDMRNEKGQRRLDDPADHVRIEIETGLAATNTRVIPVLLRQAEMPDSDKLPDSMRALSGLNAASIRGAGDDYKNDLKSLLKSLRLITNEVVGAGVSGTAELPEMITVKGGSFLMGSDQLEIEKPVRTVVINDFELSKHLITFANYDFYCDVKGITKPDDKNWGRGARPVVNVTWLEAVAFCNWVSEVNGLKAIYIVQDESTLILDTNGYRLPTEAEWEYAARGGKRDKGYTYAGSNSLDQVGWHEGNSGKRTHPIGELNSNELGIHDLSGNVWEWCADVCHDDYHDAPTDGTAWLIGGKAGSRIVRGGYWGSRPIDCRVSARCDWIENECDHDLGFRLARSPRREG
jgi:formylglycine-generating enzyme required for sulfatase activity